MNLAILVPVWPAYRWLAPCLGEALDRFWMDHPPVWFCGMTPQEGGSLPLLPWQGDVDRTNWTAILYDGVLQLQDRGITHVYVIAEEHLPLAPCNTHHLHETLPGLMQELPAVYISLMGWDNRRFPSKSPVLDKSRHHLKHLTGPRDPRFNLHPALWKLEVLRTCCEVALEDTSKNGSAWHFEKINARWPAAHDPSWKDQCYQISALALGCRKFTPAERAWAHVDRFVYRKLMALLPLIPRQKWASTFFRLMQFENVYCEGPYPHFFSGIMSKGGWNTYAIDFLENRPEEREFLNQLRQAQSQAVIPASNLD